MSNKKNLIKVEDLQVVFQTVDGTVNAVNGVNLDLNVGETLGLVGETGAGKTTTALGIMRLVQTPPGKIVNGSINFNGKNLLELSEEEMRVIRGNDISMIFQDPMTSLNPVETVGNQISEVIEIHQNLGKEESIKKAGDMLELVGIQRSRINDYPHQFSGGMKQRVVIAIALACNPKLLIADEPTTALDVTIQAQVIEMMNKLKKDFGTSMLLITHDLGVVAEVCDKVAIMYGGKIVESGSLYNIFENTKHPYTEGLFGSIPNMEEDVDRLSPIKGLMPDPTNLPSGCTFHPRCPYAKDVCRENTPKPTVIEDGHSVRCFKYEEDTIKLFLPKEENHE
ncbi:ABC transporter ATP-binding protein [Clostridium hydrogeniformans]|uniref:ABC transporter ATP-binding protein n=1 Tax=Clostridium hydrogeniformans TaxID=349933 RepID=UPI0004870506|nr:ABC transporter ATP-binding protein [Clostridium hydrogeniformans]